MLASAKRPAILAGAEIGRFGLQDDLTRLVERLHIPIASTLLGKSIIREDHPIAPTRDDSLEPHDELLFISTPEFEDELEAMLSPGQRVPRAEE